MREKHIYERVKHTLHTRATSWTCAFNNLSSSTALIPLSNAAALRGPGGTTRGLPEGLTARPELAKRPALRPHVGQKYSVACETVAGALAGTTAADDGSAMGGRSSRQIDMGDSLGIGVVVVSPLTVTVSSNIEVGVIGASPPLRRFFVSGPALSFAFILATISSAVCILRATLARLRWIASVCQSRGPSYLGSGVGVGPSSYTDNIATRCERNGCFALGDMPSIAGRWEMV